MKNFYLSILLCCAWFSNAQNDTEIENIAESEMKSASALLTFTPNPNTLNYDVTYHKLQFTVDPDVYFISGIVTTTYTALTNMSSITFDLTDELAVSSVTQNGVPLSFIQNGNDELVITLPSVQTAGSQGTVVVTYSGQPASDEQAFTATTHSGVPIIYTLSEPYGARDWWPCKQDLNDKIDNLEVWITAPSEYVSVSNGVQQSAAVSGALKTTIFEHNYPIAAYLVAIAVTNYTVITQQAGTAPNEFPIVNYLYPENTTAPGQIAQTLPIMDLFESLFETYPFSEEKYGHAQFNVGGGMEHQTVSFMGSFGRELIAHELAHQWFGDKITCGTWNDIWLNEGFATYLSGLVRENFDGTPAFVTWKNSLINNITSQPGGSVYVPDSQLDNVNRIFSSRLSYNKGAMVVEMLRWKLGDTNFFQGMRNYLADPNLAYDFALTPDLQSHLEAVSGMDLDQFFADWVYGEGHPSYNIVMQNSSPGSVQFTVNQNQSHPSVSFFEMPIEIRVLGGGQQMNFVFDHTFDGQIFTANVPFAVTSIQFDPNRHLISRTNLTSLASDSFELSAQIKIHPNPAEGQLNIAIPASVVLRKVTVYNMIGQMLLETDSETLDVERLAAGNYLVKIETADGTFTRKFLKK